LIFSLFAQAFVKNRLKKFTALCCKVILRILYTDLQSLSRVQKIFFPEKIRNVPIVKLNDHLKNIINNLIEQADSDIQELEKLIVISPGSATHEPSAGKGRRLFDKIYQNVHNRR